MLLLGLQGSPRLKGNTDYLLTVFMNEAKKFGVQTQVVHVDKKNIVPCKEYLVCEKKGVCPIDDDMKHQIYPMLREAEVVVAATPVFFYSTSAQLKALIDRSQTLWARRYMLKLTDPGSKTRRGFLLAIGATKGKNLFKGLQLTAKYFFDAINASYEGSLTYRQIERPGDMQKHPTVLEDIKVAVNNLIKPFLSRRKILFFSRENACRSQMAAAFAQYLAGDKIEALSGGSAPAEKINPVMDEAMREKGLDMGFRRPKLAHEILTNEPPALIISMDGDENCVLFPEIEREVWSLPDISQKPIDSIRSVRDEIEKKVDDLILRL
ncbi:NAD(P)H-dependent oxidoreductase [Thermodesulfobacteriota bacterium]